MTVTTLFTAASQSITSRVVDFGALEGDYDADDPLATFLLDCASAFYQAPETELFFVRPPKEWLVARRAAGQDDKVVWRLLKPLPGRRAAGARWIDHVKTVFTSKMDMERYEPIPCFYRKEDARLLVEVHMDDFHGCARRSKAIEFLTQASTHLVLKKSDPLSAGGARI